MSDFPTGMTCSCKVLAVVLGAELGSPGRAVSTSVELPLQRPLKDLFDIFATLFFILRYSCFY